MEKKKLKKLMTDVVKGKISKKEADSIINEEKTPENAPEKEIEGKKMAIDSFDEEQDAIKKSKKNTQKRKIKSREVK